MTGVSIPSYFSGLYISVGLMRCGVEDVSAVECLWDWFLTTFRINIVLMDMSNFAHHGMLDTVVEGSCHFDVSSSCMR